MTFDPKSSSSASSSFVHAQGKMSRSEYSSQTLVNPAANDDETRTERRHRGSKTPPLSRRNDLRSTNHTCERCTAPYTMNEDSERFNQQRMNSWIQSSVSDSSASDHTEPVTACGECWDKTSAKLQNSAKPTTGPSNQATAESFVVKVDSNSAETGRKSSTDPSGP
jgi:hypothetical protein